MIKKINLFRLRNAEYNEFFSEQLRIINSASAQSLPANVAAAVNNVGGILSELELMYKQDPAQQLTGRLVALDAERDVLITGLALLCDACTRHPDEATSAAAKLLQHHLRVFGTDIARRNYQEETEIIRNIVEEWESRPDLVAAALRLNTAPWLDALATANEAFTEAYLQRNTDMTEAQLPYSFKMKRHEMAAAWRALVKKIEGYHEITEGAEPWGRLMNTINTLIDQYQSLLDRREGGDEEAGGTPPEQ